MNLGKTKIIKIPEKSVELAELIGIVLGDGSVGKYRNKNRPQSTVYTLTIVGDYRFDYDYLDRHLRNMCKSLFGVDVKMKRAKTSNGFFLVVNSKQVVEFFVGMGLAIGNKIKNQVTIPNWIFENELYLTACLRGLIDTDGSIFRMSRKDPQLIRIGFTNLNLKLLSDVKDAFFRLGFHPSKIINGKSICLSRKSDISLYMLKIGFSNKKHINRLARFRSDSPVV